jgi:hypothetical protein
LLVARGFMSNAASIESRQVAPRERQPDGGKAFPSQASLASGWMLAKHFPTDLDLAPMRAKRHHRRGYLNHRPNIGPARGCTEQRRMLVARGFLAITAGLPRRPVATRGRHRGGRIAFPGQFILVSGGMLPILWS